MVVEQNRKGVVLDDVHVMMQQLMLRFPPPELGSCEDNVWFMFFLGGGVFIYFLALFLFFSHFYFLNFYIHVSSLFLIIFYFHRCIKTTFFSVVGKMRKYIEFERRNARTRGIGKV